MEKVWAACEIVGRKVEKCSVELGRHMWGEQGEEEKPDPSASL